MSEATAQEAGAPEPGVPEPGSREEPDPLDSTDLRVEVQYAVAARGLPDRHQLAAWVAAAARLHYSCAEILLRVVGAAEGRSLNEHWRKGQGTTNVLAFPCVPPLPVPMPLLGDVVICAPVAQREAALSGIAAEQHWAYLAIHGTLHLLGYDHQEPRAARHMRDAEQRVLQSFGWRHPHVA